MKTNRHPIAAATGHRLTTQAAYDVLSAGGTAVDACIAAALMACVVEPVLAGPMGGGFLMLAPSHGAPRVLDGFVQTPRRRIPGDVQQVEADFGDTTQIFHIGAGTVATPGLIPMLFEAHSRAGKMPMRELAQPAIETARNGHVVTALQAEVAQIAAPILTADPRTQQRFGTAERIMQAGDTLTTPDLADVLEVLAIEGPRLFTEGEVAQALLSLDGTALTADDLRRYAPKWRDPLQMTRRGWQVSLTPSPSIGGAQIALMLDALPDQVTPALLHLAQIELLNLREKSDTTLRFDPILAAELRKTLARHDARLRGTTHISATDQQGLGAALTLSNGTGAGMIVPGTGIMPNNMLGEEDLLPAGPGSWEQDIRLASAMCPISLRAADGSITMMGSGGSSRIRTALSQTALHLIDGMALEQAILAPRLHLDALNGPVAAEPGGERWYDALRALPADLNLWPDRAMYFGGVHAVRRSPRGQIEAVADPRRDGFAQI